MCYSIANILYTVPHRTIIIAHPFPFPGRRRCRCRSDMFVKQYQPVRIPCNSIDDRWHVYTGIVCICIEKTKYNCRLRNTHDRSTSRVGALARVHSVSDRLDFRRIITHIPRRALLRVWCARLRMIATCVCMCDAREYVFEWKPVI